MKVLIINKDEAVLDSGSASFCRHLEYGKLVEELHIIVSCRQSTFKNRNFGNVFIYPTNSWNKLSAIFDAIKIGKKILRPDFLITTQDVFETGLVGWLLSRKFKLPLQLQIHTDFLSPYFWRESFLNKIRVLMAKFLIPRASCLRVVSERIARSLYFMKVRATGSSFFESASEPTRRRREGLRCEKNEIPATLSKKINVLPIFVDVEKIKNTPVKINLHEKYPQFDFIILMASRFTKEKNIGLALQALHNANIANKTANNAKQNIGLIIVGAGLEEKKLKAESYGLEANIIFENWCDDLVSYYKTADLFLLTSNYEGYGMTAVEALAAGCPVIMTDVGCAGEAIKNGENGIVIPVGNVEKLAEAIVDVINNDRQINGSLGLAMTKEQYLSAYKKSWEFCLVQ